MPPKVLYCVFAASVSFEPALGFFMLSVPLPWSLFQFLWVGTVIPFVLHMNYQAVTDLGPRQDSEAKQESIFPS